jgi:tetratricopeptide (TPR) repeat protein
MGSGGALPPLNGDLGDPCTPFAADLSALVDGEVDETIARRLIVHLEICDRCRAFFSSMQAMARTHRELAQMAGKADPATLTSTAEQRAARERVRRIVGRRAFRRFAAVLYRIGKAYLLTTIDRTYRTEIFRQPVAVDSESVRGRRLVDRILARGEGRYDGFDWIEAGRLLEQNFDSDVDLRERARALLDQALALKPNFAEARLYLGFYYKLAGDLRSAEREFRRVFDSARNAENRGHAGTQLVTVHEAQGNLVAALDVIERMLARRLPEHDARFYFTYFNLAVIRALRGEFSQSAAALATLTRRFPDRIGEIRQRLANSQPLRDAFHTSPEFRTDVERRIPALFSNTN